MKLTSVELTPQSGSGNLAMSFRDPSRNTPYHVKGIVGLDADEIVPRYYRGSGNSSKFYAMTLEKKEVVVKVQLNPRFEQDETFSSLRDDIYRLIAASRTGKVNLNFKNDEVIAAVLSGFVSKVEAPLFEKNQEIQITLNCDGAMLRSPTAINLDVSDLDPVSTTVTDLLSTAPHGFEFMMAVLETRPYFSISDPDDPSWGFVVQPTTGILEDDIIYLSSEHNDKQLFIIRGVDVIHMADAIVSGSVWPILFPGDNKLFVEDSVSFEWLSISHYPAYWGI